MLSPLEPQAGRILISEPFLNDPNFKRSVVLLADHQLNGSFGFIVNQPSEFLLKELVEDFSDSDFKVFTGGPVEVDTLHFIHRCHDKLNSGEEIAKGIYWGGNFEALKVLINANSIGAEEIKFFIGYSGWGEGQLINEIKENTWIVSEKYRPDTIFSQSEEQVWRDVIVDLGPKYAHISNFPQDPNLN